MRAPSGLPSSPSPSGLRRLALLRLATVVAAAGYLAAVDAVYRTHLSPLFSYDGALYQPANDGSLTVAYLLALAPAAWLPIRIARPSQVVEWVLYVLAYVPSIVFPYLILGTGFAGVAPWTAAVAVSFALFGLMQGLRPNVVRPRSIVGPGLYRNGLLLLALGLAAYVVAAFGVNANLPDPTDVYDVRADFNNAVGSSLPFVAYAVAWSGNVVNPMLIVVGLVRRQWVLVAVGVLLELLIYGTSGYKSALFSVLLLGPLIVLLGARARSVAGPAIAGSAALLVVASWATDLLTDSLLATALFVRRLIALPGQLAANYYEYFSDNPTYALSHSVLGWLNARPDRLDPPNLIGAAYFGDPGTSANASLWADGMSNFGPTGIVLATILLGVAMWGLDAVADGRDLRITGSIAGLMGLLLANSGILTTLMNHGLLLTIVLVALLPGPMVLHRAATVRQPTHPHRTPLPQTSE